MKRNVFTLSLKTKLFLISMAILIIPTLVLGSIFYDTSKNKVEQQLMLTAKGNIELLNNMLTQTIEQKMKEVDLLSYLVQIGDEANIQSALDQYQKLHNELENTYVGTENGQFIKSPKSEIPKDFDARTRPWFKMAMEKKGEVIITSPYTTPSGKYVVGIAKVTNDGKGVVGINLDLQQTAQTVNKVKIGNEGYALVMDNNKKIVIHPTLKPGSESSGPQVDYLYSVDSGEIEYDVNGQLVKQMSVTNKITGWKIAGTMYSNEINREAETIFYNTLWVVLLSTAIGTVIIYLFTRSIINPVKALITVSSKISQGDLSERVSILSKDELGQLGKSFNQMADSLQTTIIEVNEASVRLAESSQLLADSAEQTGKATEQIATTIQEVAFGSDKQLKSVEVTSRTVDEISAGVQQIVVYTDTVFHTSAEASDKASEGSESLQKVTNQMNTINQTILGLSHTIKDLGELSQEIGEIISVITGISEQTNLLALNAAIEAARAGEHGKGFAVVADEVRKLAEQSAKSAEQISQLISTIQDRTDKAVQSVELATGEVEQGINAVVVAGQSFEQIQNSANDVTSQIKEVAASINQIAESVSTVVESFNLVVKVAEETSSGTQNVSAATEEQLASSEEITAYATSLSNMAKNLEDVVGRFKI